MVAWTPCAVSSEAVEEFGTRGRRSCRAAPSCPRLHRLPRTTMASNTEKTSPPAFGEGLRPTGTSLDPVHARPEPGPMTAAWGCCPAPRHPGELLTRSDVCHVHADRTAAERCGVLLGGAPELVRLAVLRLSSNGCGWVEARSAGRRGVLAARAASELTAHGVHLTGGGRGAPWPGVGRSGVAAGRPACQRATRVLRCATALRVTHRPSLRSSSRYGPCGPAWTGASRPSTTTRKARRLAVRG